MRAEILLAHFPKLTYKRYSQLKSRFSDMEAAWQANRKKLASTGWDENFVHEFVTWRDELDVEKTKKILEQEEIRPVLFDDIEYPELLKEIYDPPACLFVRGDLKNLNFPLAVVGPRKFSPYGKQITEELVGKMAKSGITIVSGLALGIDGIAHLACLEAGGKTIAVLGCGNDARHVQPSGHRYIAEKIIASGGAVITEYPPGMLPSKYTFPRRNRIIAGMTLGTLVTEASEGSGSLITAQCAIDNDREVFTVPQNITSPTAIGSNNLLKMGAKPVTEVEDLLEALNLHDVQQYVTNKAIVADSPDEAKVLEHLTREAIHVDSLILATKLDSPTMNSTLTLMEMKGKVKNLGGMMYVLAR
jgi:DNA processing protein